MTLSKGGLSELPHARSLLNTIIEQPNLARTIRGMPPQTFAALVRKVGVEDAGELVALATTEQLVQAFDEDLFVSERAGERESLDVERFALWLEVLLEAGDGVAAERIAELDEDFVAHALDGILLVLDSDALRERLDESDEEEARMVDKALESALAEDVDGYILVAKQHDGWEAVFTLVLALDRDHRALLVRLLDRLARVGSARLDDLDELSTVLSEGESLAEDAEAAREERRSRQGYVEPRAARAFLTLAKQPPGDEPTSTKRDPLTRAYFRAVDRGAPARMAGSPSPEAATSRPPAVLRALERVGSSGIRLAEASQTMTTVDVFTAALRDLALAEIALFGERMDEFAYLANVLVAGHHHEGSRLRLQEAADAVVATVCYGAVLDFRARHFRGSGERPPNRADFMDVLRRLPADVLFRIASSALASGKASDSTTAAESGLIYSAEELERVLQ